MKDLFNNEYQESDLLPAPKTLIYKKLGKYNYGKSTDKTRRCKTCGNLIGAGYHNKQYYKCRIVGCSRSQATDIRVNNICDLYEKA